MLAVLGLFFKGVLGGILSFLKWCVENWKIVLPIVIIGLTVWYIFHLRGIISTQDIRHVQDVAAIQQWETKFTELRDKYDAAVLDFKTTVSKQNEKVNAIAKQAEKFKKAAEQAKIENQQIQKAAEQRIQAILNAPRPKTADESIQYLIDQAKGLSEWEKHNEKPNN